MIKIKISSVVEGVWQKVLNGIGRGPSEKINNRSYFQHVGFSSIPKENDIAIAIEDNNNVSVVATVDHEDDRPVLSGNEKTAIYADKDIYIMLGTDGKIEVSNGNGKIVLNSSGDIELGEGVLKKLMTEAMINVYNTHTHLDPISGSTGVPSVLLSASLHATTKTEAL